MIKPTIGRVVHFHPEPNVTHAAIVTYVWSATLVNLVHFDPNGVSHGITSVPLVQDEAQAENYHMYCEWMPYQKGQAAKTESLEKEIAETQVPG